MIQLLPILFRARRRVPLRTPPAPPNPNLLLWSEQFQQAEWASNGVTVTTDQANDPNGALTADLLDPLGAGSFIQQISGAVPVANGFYTASVYAKRGPTSVGTEGFAIYLLEDGAVVQSVNNDFVLTDEWERSSVTAQLGAAPTSVGFRLYPDVNGDGTDAHAWGAKLEVGSVATSYVKREGV